MSSPAKRKQEDESAGPVGAGDLDERDEVDLSSLLDLQDDRQAKESKRSNLLILRFCGLLLVAGLVWYAASSRNRRRVDGLIQNVKESRRGLDQVRGPERIESPYDRILDKLGSRSVDIDKATRSLGVDPTTVKEDGMDAEMKGMMGGKGTTVGERERMVEGIAHVAGIELPKPGGRMASPELESPTKPSSPDDGTEK